MIVAISRLAVDGLIVAHAEDGDDCDKDGHDQHEEPKILSWDRMLPHRIARERRDKDKMSSRMLLFPTRMPPPISPEGPSSDYLIIN